MALSKLLLSKTLITVPLVHFAYSISLQFTNNFIGAFFPGQNQDGTKIISGGADNAARLFDIQSGQSSQVAQHDNAVKVVKWIETPQGGILATGSWDKTLKVRTLHLFILLRTDDQLNGWLPVVLGPTNPKPDHRRSTSRAMLLHGRAVSLARRGHRRAPHCLFRPCQKSCRPTESA